MKVANQWTFKEGPHIITKVLDGVREAKEESQRETRLQKQGQRDATLLASKMEEGASSQRMWEASRSWKRPGNIFSP